MNDLNPDAVRHADTCDGVPVCTEDSLGQWEAVCSRRCGWEVTGCESRAEAGACFYGYQPNGPQNGA